MDNLTAAEEQLNSNKMYHGEWSSIWKSF